VDIVVEKETGDIVSGFAQFTERVKGAGPTAYMEQDIHDDDYGQIIVAGQGGALLAGQVSSLAQQVNSGSRLRWLFSSRAVCCAAFMLHSRQIKIYQSALHL
jgi:hypothetical protein